MSQEIHAGDTGTLIEVTVKDGSSAVDISTATVKKYHFVHPGGTVASVAADFKTDGTDGVLTYTSLAGTFPDPGNYRLQVEIQMPTGSWKSEVAQFRVYPNLA